MSSDAMDPVFHDRARMHAAYAEEELADLVICCGMFLGMGRTLAVVGGPRGCRHRGGQ